MAGLPLAGAAGLPLLGEARSAGRAVAGGLMSITIRAAVPGWIFQASFLVTGSMIFSLSTSAQTRNVRNSSDVPSITWLAKSI